MPFPTKPIVLQPRVQKARDAAIDVSIDIWPHILEFGSQSSADVITAATMADPVVITSASHGLSDNNKIYIHDVTGMAEINRKRYTVNNQATNTFELQTFDSPLRDIDGTAFAAFTGTAVWRQVQTVSSVTATHTPRNVAGTTTGTVATISVGTIANYVVPLTLPDFNNDNPSGDGVVHFVDFTVTLSNPTETPIFRLEVEVPY